MSDSETKKEAAGAVEAAQESPEQKHERFRQEIRELQAHMIREAQRQKPPRFIRFSEAPIGSRIFANRRFFDEKDPVRVLSEEIYYDPSMFWDAPPGAFYALLWHEFGHGETRHVRIEREDEKTFAEQMERYGPGTVMGPQGVTNVKTDIFIDANNRHDRPGLLAPYRVTYEYFFPRETKAPVPQLRELGVAGGWPEDLLKLGEQLQAALERPRRFMLALKHEGYWYWEDRRQGVKPEDRPVVPGLDEDKILTEHFERVREALVEASNGKKGTPGRSELWNRVIAPEYFSLLEEQRREVQEAMDETMKQMGVTKDDLKKLGEAVRQAAKEAKKQDLKERSKAIRDLAEGQRDKAEQTESEGETRAKGEEARAEEKRRQAKELRAEGTKATEKEAERLLREADGHDQKAEQIREAASEKAEKLREEAEQLEAAADELETQISSPSRGEGKGEGGEGDGAGAEKIPSPSRGEGKGEGGEGDGAGAEKIPSPSRGEGKGEGGEGEGTEDLADDLIDAVDEYSEAVPQKGLLHAEHEEQDIDESDEHHPSNEDFGKTYQVDKPKKSEKQPEKPSKGSGADLSAEQRRLDKLKEWGITPNDDQDYRDTKRFIDEQVLNELITGLVALFAEDRQRLILTDMPYGRLPTARKVEALRRRYQGEQVPPVREIKKKFERFMGVDLIVANDHSGSMSGDKERAAKATNAAMAHACYRVNTEIARRMKGMGFSQADIDSAPPLRYLGLLFSDNVLAMNRRGWEDGLVSRQAQFEDKQMEEEKFVVEMFGTYRKMGMGGTNDFLAAAQALYEAFGKDLPAIKKSEERVKVLVFITDGVGAVEEMSELMKYLHGKSEAFPEWTKRMLDQIESGAAQKVEDRIRKYRDQIFALGIGIPTPGLDARYKHSEIKTFAEVYNEGKVPDERDPRVREDNNVIIVELKDAPTMPRRILRLMKAKFHSPKFKQIRNRFLPPTGGRHLKRR